MDEPVGNQVRTYRKEVNLSQYELGKLVGYADDGQVSRHERSRSLPTLIVALSYQVIFDVPISELFAGLHECVEQSVEGRLSELEDKLRQYSGSGFRAAAAERKLEWLKARQSHNYRR